MEEVDITFSCFLEDLDLESYLKIKKKKNATKLNFLTFTNKQSMLTKLSIYTRLLRKQIILGCLKLNGKLHLFSFIDF